MTNEQLYLAMGVPLLFNSLLFILLAMTMNRGFNSLERRIERIEEDMKEFFRLVGQMETRMAKLEEKP